MTARLPIRWRLTVWYTVLLATALAVFGVALFVGLRYRLYGSFDEQLEAQAGLTLASVQTADGRLALPRDEEADPRSGEHLLRLFDATGRVIVDSSPAFGGLALDEAPIAAARGGRTAWSSYRVDDEALRVISVPVRDEDGSIVGVLQVGLFRDDIDEAIGQLLGALAVAIPLVLVVAAGGGYLLSRRALAPVTTITTLAAGIGGDDLHARLDLDLPDDELGRLARTFDGMLARIEEAFERQRRFTGDAAHELRTPLSLMRSQVDLALSLPRSPEGDEEAFRGFQGDVDRLTGLVATLLALARADSGRLPVEREPVDLAAVVASALEQFSPVADEAGVALHDESSPAPLLADDDLLVQVLVNLIDNALAHTPRGGHVTVGCAADGDRLRLWVADTGSGIAEEDQARIFDRFYRVDDGRTRRNGGVGLGLAMCRAIVAAHGGTIDVRSRLGSGSRFEVILPVGGPPEKFIVNSSSSLRL